VLVFAAAVETAQHQEKIDNIGVGAGSAYLQLDVIDFELAQLKLQFGQIGGLTGQELCVGQAQHLFLFRVPVEIFVDSLYDRGFEKGDEVNFVQKIVQLTVDGGQED
jgi:hypothetical protein